MRVPRLTFEQYKILVAREREAKKYREVLHYKDLIEEWGLPRHVFGTAVNRGIKMYDIRILEEEDARRQRVPTGSVARRNGKDAVEILPAGQSRGSLGQYPAGRTEARS